MKNDYYEITNWDTVYLYRFIEDTDCCLQTGNYKYPKYATIALTYCEYSSFPYKEVLDQVGIVQEGR